MRLMSTSVTMLLAAATLGGAVSMASAQSCDELWVERNSYYKQAGYCFKTARAIGYFGNGGCYVNSESAMRFSPDVRARINQIVRLERQFGCAR
ncbi:MAG: hypothetical protein QOG83_3199 [Alphaproteobacteria bacterium]|jgi:hypothetical protein|nr:hypothetical protein [Alphaproteobacteria bacterium]MEA2990488.1 hypothetical protein [Alphaproteobacteria bacterium]